MKVWKKKKILSPPYGIMGESQPEGKVGNLQNYDKQISEDKVIQEVPSELKDGEARGTDGESEALQATQA